MTEMERDIFESTATSAICKGLVQAIDDYAALFEIGSEDVTPKEDQIKCAIYSAAIGLGLLVHVEGARGRNQGRLDLKLISRSGEPRKAAVIEIKKAWAGQPRRRGEGWNNYGQRETWVKDIANLQNIKDPIVVARYFALGFSYQTGHDAGVRREIEELTSMPCVSEVARSERAIPIGTSSGLNWMDFFLFSVAPAPLIQPAP
ncbi:hypothetical protein [Dongia sedimenti]|uniref:Restriction endonuclease n=1 Tax=Dongia sedimenti TaxID=3064282 RepID=A0ABU0YWZ2_9PROT|nr:hypothetical protein [Rhodospirillaceae bacterium R-7]